THIDFAPAPESLDQQCAVFRVHLEVKQTKELYTWVSCSVGDGERRALIAYESAFSAATEQLARVEARESTIYSSSERFNDRIHRSQADLRMMVAATPSGPYPYAGVPWFSVPFGRDGIWTAIESLWLNPDVAAG